MGALARWTGAEGPEGGIVQAATADRRGNPYSVLAIQSLYVITADPLAVWARCSAAGLAVVHEPAAPHYDPEGLIFSVRDPEGHLWSFGTYNGLSWSTMSGA